MRFVLCALTILTASATLHAQNLVAGDPTGAPFAEIIGQSPLYPGMGPQINAYPQAPILPAPPAAIPTGAVTIDGTNGRTWYTDGFVIANVPHNAYPGLAPVIPPYPIVPFGGPITGMAIDPVGGILWMTDGFLVAGFPPGVPGAPPIVPPFAPLPVVPFGPLTGLDWDPFTGSLWATDIGGVCINFVPGGFPAGPAWFAPPAAGPYTGIAIDKTGVGPFGFRPLYVAGPGIVFEVTVGSIAPLPMGIASGLTYHPAPSLTPPGPPCPCGPQIIGQALRGPMVTGNPNFGVDLTGLAPGQLTLFAFDFGFNPAFPVINTLGCPFGFTFGSPTLNSRFAIANAAGVAASPFNLVGIPPGSTLYLQIGTTCALDPAGFVLSPLYQFIVSAP